MALNLKYLESLAKPFVDLLLLLLFRIRIHELSSLSCDLILNQGSGSMLQLLDLYLN